MEIQFISVSVLVKVLAQLPALYERFGISLHRQADTVLRKTDGDDAGFRYTISVHMGEINMEGSYVCRFDCDEGSLFQITRETWGFDGEVVRRDIAL